MKKKEEKHENAERWLLTYSDLITLLMALFVILYATSNVDPTKYKQLSYSLQIALGTSSGGSSGILDGGESIDMNGFAQILADAAAKNAEADYEKLEEEKLTKVKEQVDKLIEGSALNGSAITNIEERGLVITFKDNLFFDSGKASVKDQYKRQLQDLSRILESIDNYVRIEGHTDNVPISTAYFSSNWQLSSARASNVVEIFVTQGKVNPNRLSAVGYGEYRPVATNVTEEGRAANRRVDIVILNSKFNNSEIKQR